MVDTTEIEKITGKKVREIQLKEGTENIYIVVLENNLEQDWKLEGSNWTCLG